MMQAPHYDRDCDGKEGIRDFFEVSGEVQLLPRSLKHNLKDEDESDGVCEEPQLDGDASSSSQDSASQCFNSFTHRTWGEC